MESQMNKIDLDNEHLYASQASSMQSYFLLALLNEFRDNGMKPKWYSY